MRRAILHTAARAHWRHDYTGRATPRAGNDNQLASGLPGAGEGGSASIRNAAAILVLAGMAVLVLSFHGSLYV
jgi:hypothetical protein